MTDPEQDRFEQELRQQVPSKLPPDFSERLNQAWNPGNRVPTPRQRVPRLSWLRWLAPAAAAVAAGIVVLMHLRLSPPPIEKEHRAPPATTALKASDIEINRRLVTSFRAVATLPSGEPVQVQCREWLDQVELRDSSRGVAIQQQTPRFEILPVEIETF